MTNSQGQVVITLTANQSSNNSPNDILTAVAQGDRIETTVEVKAATITVSVIPDQGEPVGSAITNTSCQKILAEYRVNGNVQQTGTVNITTSRGRIYSNDSCTGELLSSSVQIVGGKLADAYLRSDTAGIATITAAIEKGPMATTTVEFTAELTSSATIHLQAEPAVIGSNVGTGQSQQSVLTAVVRDGSGSNNFVKGAVVEFSIIDDASGGVLSNPTIVSTESNGTATVTFTAGTATTPQDGVTIAAKIQGKATTATTFLTVAKKSLFISAGTGNLLESPTSTTYQKDYVVFVTDASGNPVPGAAVTATLIPTRYRKGQYFLDVTGDTWFPDVVDTCVNEDTNLDGILSLSSPNEDYNDNGRLDPGIPASVTSGATTDATGTATISILYPKDRAQWTEVRLNIRATVAGTEAVYPVLAHWLPVLASDVTNEDISPPWHISPYGVNACNVKD